jgi:dipeptidyl-peptidase-4
MIQASNANLQARTPKASGAENHRTSSSKVRRRGAEWFLELWSLKLLWSLVVGSWSFLRGRHFSLRPVLSCFILLNLIPTFTFAQDRLKTMPAYEQAQRWSRDLTNLVKLGNLSVTWKDEGKAFEYRKEGKRYRYDIATGKTEEVGAGTTNAPSETADEQRGGGRRGNRPPGVMRGRQQASALSPNGKLKAFYRDRNIWLTGADGTNEVAITQDGSEKTRIKYGTATWVYGEELDQTTAIWWSTNSDKVAFYRFDESGVLDFYLVGKLTSIQDRMEVEPYPKAGATNPIPDLFIYDVNTKNSVRVDVRDGKPFDDAVLGHYVYGISWTQDGRELLFHRTNRRQNILELCAADPETGKCRVVVREEWPASWVANSPTIRFLKDGKRFIWASERTGWKNFYLYDLSGHLHAQLTQHSFEVAEIVRADEDVGWLYYTARSGDNPLKLQLHRVRLDGHDGQRLTDPALHHSIDLAPDGKHFIDVAQTHDSPPVTSLMDTEGQRVTELARSDMTRFWKLHLHPTELLLFKADDGQTDLYGMLHFPPHFSPDKKYPLLISVYAGPETAGANETFTTGSALTHYGFLYATFDSRSANGRGKRCLDAIYQKLGTVEIDDQAAGVKSLWPRRYLDKKRVGIFGTSYGGTASALCLLRHPEVFHAACSSSPVTDFRNYDTIYTERYMWLPQDNKAGYDAGSMMTYANKLQGRLMLYYGTADDNVHPSNMMQLIQALQRAGKSFELQVGPDQGHSAINRERMLEFFLESFAMR